VAVNSPAFALLAALVLTVSLAALVAEASAVDMSTVVVRPRPSDSPQASDGPVAAEFESELFHSIGVVQAAVKVTATGRSLRVTVLLDTGFATPATVAYEAAWQPFGVEVPLSGQGEEKYLGKKAPEEDGLYWFGARQYDPETGRFQGLDPVHGVLAAPQTLNRYAYATNDPVGNADPNGMCEFVCLAIILVAIGLTLGVTATVVPEVGAVLDPVMLALGFIPFVGDFLSDPYFAARSVTECALGRCDAANLGSDLAFLFLPGGPLSNVAHGRRLLSATTGGLFGAGRMGNRADDLTYLARAGTRDNYRRMLVGFTGVDTGDAFQPHHVFPQKFERYPSPP